MLPCSDLVYKLLAWNNKQSDDAPPWPMEKYKNCPWTSVPAWQINPNLFSFHRRTSSFQCLLYQPFQQMSFDSMWKYHQCIKHKFWNLHYFGELICYYFLHILICCVLNIKLTLLITSVWDTSYTSIRSYGDTPLKYHSAQAVKYCWYSTI